MKINKVQKFLIISVVFVTCNLEFVIFKYWYADVLYSRGKLLNNSGEYLQAAEKLNRAVKYSSRQAVYYDELSKSYSQTALELYRADEKERVEPLAKSAMDAINRGITVSPGNFHLWKSKAALYIKLAEIDKDLLEKAIAILEATLLKSPNDAKITYNLALLYEQTGDHTKALEVMKKTVELKANYKEARYALAILYKRAGKKDSAKSELNYILKYLAPNDENSQKMLEYLRD